MNDMIDGKKVMYLSIPITGMPEADAKQRAKEVKEQLKEEYPDYVIYTPFDVVPIDGMPYGYYMGRCIEFMIQSSDQVCFVYDYDESKGCSLELSTAKIYNIPYFIRTENPICRTESENIGRENAEKTFLKSEKKNRIIKKLTDGTPFTLTSSLIIPLGINGNVITATMGGEPYADLMLEKVIDKLGNGELKFVEL